MRPGTVAAPRCVPCAVAVDRLQGSAPTATCCVPGVDFALNATLLFKEFNDGNASVEKLP